METKIKPAKVLLGAAIHEASHAVAHYVFGLRFNYIEVYEPLMGGLLRRNKSIRIGISGNKERIEKEIIINLSGLWAELKFFGSGDPKINGCIFGACDDDIRTAYDLCEVYFSKKGTYNNAKSSELYKKAKELVTNNYQTIEAIAKELVVKKRMDYKKCVEIMERNK